MKYAIVRSGSKQYKVKEGDEILVEKIEGETGDKISLDEVLLMAENGVITVGKPLVLQARVIASLRAQEKGEKLRVATYRAKSRHRRTLGHRQRLTRLRIETISTKQHSTKAKRKM